MFLVVALSFGLCSFVIAKFTDDPDNERFTAETVLLEMPDADPSTPQTEPQVALAMLPDNDIVPAPKLKPAWAEISTKVRPGDNLALIFKRNGLSAKDVHLVSTSKPLGSRLKNIFPGHEMTFYVDDEKRLMRLTYSSGPLEKLEYERAGDDPDAALSRAAASGLSLHEMHALLREGLFAPLSSPARRRQMCGAPSQQPGPPRPA